MKGVPTFKTTEGKYIVNRLELEALLIAYQRGERTLQIKGKTVEMISEDLKEEQTIITISVADR